MASDDFNKAAAEAAKEIRNAALPGNGNAARGNSAIAAAILAHAYALRDLSTAVRWRRG